MAEAALSIKQPNTDRNSTDQTNANVPRGSHRIEPTFTAQDGGILRRWCVVLIHCNIRKHFPVPLRRRTALTILYRHYKGLTHRTRPLDHYKTLFLRLFMIG